MPNSKREKACAVSKNERQKVQSSYTKDCAACWSVCNVEEAMNLPVTKERQFYHSKASSTNFTKAIVKFKQKKAFAGYKSGIWGIYGAYVDKLAERKR